MNQFSDDLFRPHSWNQTEPPNSPPTVEREAGLISDGLADQLDTISQVVAPVIEVPGVIFNVINVVVFRNIGLADTVTSSFFALSLSDMLYLLTSLFTWICFTLDSALDQQRVRLDQLYYLSIFYGLIFLAISTFITTYIAIQRCCCVVLPLKFKGVFTARRNTVVIVVICTLGVALYLPILTNQGMKVYVDPESNRSWYGLWFSDDRKYLLEMVDFLAATLLPIVTQVVTVVCLILLTSSLRKSSRFRQAAASVPGKQRSGVRTSGKEIQAVKAVTLVTLMFIASNTPSICGALTRRFVPSFDVYERYHNLFNVVNTFRSMIQYLNASLNILVYYNFNSAYRAMLKERILAKLGLVKKAENSA